MGFLFNHGDPRWGRIAATGVLALGLGVVALKGWTTIPAGHVGVRSRFGDVQESELTAGFHLKNPLDSIIDMSVRTREIKEETTVPTNEGLIASLDVSVLYHLDPQRANEVYAQLGDDTQYEENVVSPLARSEIRDVVAGYSSEDLYTTRRQEISQEIMARLDEELGRRGFILENVLLRDVDLPERIIEAIEEKLSAEQAAQQMVYVLQRETQEAERRRIEADGIAQAQEIISGSLTAEYLQWKYIETLQAVVGSPNNTVVIMPYDTNLTPMLQIPTGQSGGQ